MVLGGFLGASKAAGATGDGSEKKAVAIQPSELTGATQLNKNRRLVGRVVNVDKTDSLFKCCLVCGPTRRQTIEIEAWRELSGPASQHLEAGKLVSLTSVSLGVRKAEKMKFSLCGTSQYIRFEKTLRIDSAEDEKDKQVVGFTDMTLKDLYPCMFHSQLLRLPPV